jgi:hypothetical protein
MPTAQQRDGYITVLSPTRELRMIAMVSQIFNSRDFAINLRSGRSEDLSP